MRKFKNDLLTNSSQFIDELSFNSFYNPNAGYRAAPEFVVETTALSAAPMDTVSADFSLNQMVDVSYHLPNFSDAAAAKAPDFVDEGALCCACSSCGGTSAAAAGVQGLGGGITENGTGTTIVAVAASGNQGIDGLLRGNRWDATGITYSDPNSTADYGAGYDIDPNNDPLTGFSQLTASQLEATHYALNEAVYTQVAGAQGYSVEGFSNLSLTYVGGGSGNATIRSANSSDPGTAYAYYPSNSQMGGDAFYGGAGNNPVQGSYHWHTVLHELGHSLGLKHGQDTSGFGAMPTSLDAMEFSVMTYRSYVGGPPGPYSNETWGYAQTYMMYDIAALQYMYGADFTSNSGNTTYTWNTSNGDHFVDGVQATDPGGNRIFMTIWDGNGTDTYDFSNYTTDIRLDLDPGQWVDLDIGGNFQRANLGGGNYAKGHVYNALQYNGDVRSLIENGIAGSGNDILDGNNANNVLTGNAGNDTFYAGNGNDVMYGGVGNDTLFSGAGNDTGFGSSGNDILYGSSGNDNLYGGNDNDSLYGGDGTDNIYGGAGNDYMVGGAGQDDIFGGSGDDTAFWSVYTSADTFDGGTGIDTIRTSGYSWSSSVDVDLQVGEIQLNGAFLVTLANFENYDADANTASSNEDVYGTSGDNIISTAGGTNLLDGRGGNDTLSAGGGNDMIYGGSGTDVMYGGDGNDTMQGGTGTDTAYGGAGDDLIQVLSGQFWDNAYGGTGTDTLDHTGSAFTGNTIDFVAGTITGTAVVGGTANISAIEIYRDGSGNNTIRSDGSGEFYGGAGDDYMYAGAGTNETIDGGTGIDTIDTTHWTGGYVLNLVTGATNYGSESFVNFENAVTGSGNDTLTGTGGVNIISTNAGNDTIDAGGGADTVNGGTGNDTVLDNDFVNFDVHDGGAGIDTIDYSGVTFSPGLVTIDLDAGLTSVSGGNTETILNFENALGSDGGETIVGTSGVNNLSGSGGDDILKALDGNDTLDGGAGDDVLYGQGDDDILTGGTGDDSLVGGLGNDELYGSADNDLLNGQAGDDTLSGDNGDDTLLGAAGDDTIYGGDGTDNVIAGGGNDTAFGGLGNDTINGGIGFDNISGGGGDDVLMGGNQNDVLNGNAGLDDLDGNAGNDTLYGGANDDSLSGSAGADLLFGDSGNDSLSGGAGGDDLFGGIGNDMLYGGGGNDDMNGGAGADIFVANLGFRTDRIQDFEDGIDRIDFSSNSLANNIGQVLAAASQVGANVRIDLNANNILILEGFDLADLDASDFIF